MEPVATYRERVVRGLKIQRRTFTLYPDRVEVHLRWGQVASDLQLPLAEFRAAPPVRSKLRLAIGRRANLWAMVFFMSLCAVLLVRSTVPSLMGPGVWGTAILAVVGVLAGCLTIALLAAWRFRRPVDVAKFLGADGAVKLDILRSGPDAKRFADFVDAIRKQIKSA